MVILLFFVAIISVSLVSKKQNNTIDDFYDVKNFIKDQLGKVASQIDAQCKVDPKAIELLNQSAQFPGANK